MLFRRERGLSREETLSSRPVRNELASWRRNDRGEIVIRIPLRKSGVVRRAVALFGLPDHREIVLDRVGSEVWEMFDGRRRARDVVLAFAERQRVGRREAQVSVIAFLEMLTRRGLVGLAVEKPPGGAPRRNDGGQG
jgi:hypothetical protein